ncbi:MAG: succinate dehydrogenase, hydrophobic membrane anchor protein [Candidatus Portiera sp.]|nr:succinate dehydrogenase, hydrophobic membrane anchor protein [Portiera sp.]
MSSTNFTRNGLTDWLVQRLSAVVLLGFVLYVVGFYAWHSYLAITMTYDLWYGYFSSLPMKIFTLIALLALLGHLWIGIWTIITDYIKPLVLRLLLQSLLLLFVLAILIWVGLIVFSL